MADFFGVTVDYLLGQDNHHYIMADGLTDEQIQHLSALVQDSASRRKDERGSGNSIISQAKGGAHGALRLLPCPISPKNKKDASASYNESNYHFQPKEEKTFIEKKLKQMH